MADIMVENATHKKDSLNNIIFLKPYVSNYQFWGDQCEKKFTTNA
jgi:hypothetical protein